ncbi:MAG: DUF1826 domain-containing protein [Pseudomonadota bacterium]
MNLATTVVSPNKGVTFTDTPEGFSAIKSEDCAAVVWRRRPLAEFQKWIDDLPSEALPKARLITKTEWTRDALREVIVGDGQHDSEERELLADDAAALATLFAQVTQAPYVRLRLDVVTTNACRRFHIDALTARLVCTYRGTGTQFGHSQDGEDPTDITTVPTASPIVLRGTEWPARPDPGLLHRSPPIEGTGETRLLFVVDPIFDLDEAQDQERVTLH